MKKIQRNRCLQRDNADFSGSTFYMGGLWVDYELVIHHSDYSLTRKLIFRIMAQIDLELIYYRPAVDGYFIAPYTIPNYLSGELKADKITTDHPFAGSKAYT
jgi:succinate dehydrogenase / fumarate reductase flavoprotein subunit